MTNQKTDQGDNKAAGDAWMNYIQDFEKLRQFWKNLGPVTGLWIAQQIDIFAGKYPSPVPVQGMDEKGISVLQAAEKYAQSRLIETEDGKCANTFDVIVWCIAQFSLMPEHQGISKEGFQWTNELVLDFAKQYRFSSSRLSIEMFMDGKGFPSPSQTISKEVEEQSGEAVIAFLKKLQDEIEGYATQEESDFEKNVYHSQMGDLYTAIKVIKLYKNTAT